MARPGTEQELIGLIDRNELVELAKSLVRIPSFIGEEGPLDRQLLCVARLRG